MKITFYNRLILFSVIAFLSACNSDTSDNAAKYKRE